MAVRPDVVTLRFSRSELARLIQDPRLLRAFENLAADVSETLPDAIASASSDVETVLAGGIFGRRAEPAAIPGGINDAASIMAADTFRQRAQPELAVGRAPDASIILATKIFGA